MILLQMIVCLFPMSAQDKLPKALLLSQGIKNKVS